MKRKRGQALFGLIAPDPFLAGLTFVELLIAVTMIAVLFVGLSTHLRGGMNVWQRVTRQTQARQQQRAALERLTRDLANAVLLSEDPAAYGSAASSLTSFNFAAETLDFYTIAPDRNGLMQPVAFVSYKVDACGESRCLMRRVWSLAEARNAPSDASQYPDYEPILEGCTGLSIQYAYLPSDDPNSQPQALIWQALWEQPDDKRQLPRLLRLSLAVDMPAARRGAGAEPASRLLSTVANIPSGVLRAAPSSPSSP